MIENLKLLLFLILFFAPLAWSINIWAKGIADELVSKGRKTKPKKRIKKNKDD